jgi:GTPase SAR1 family protein
LRQHADSNITIMLVGNKSDLKHLREITEERATNFCEEHGLNLVETSAKDNSNVEFAFQKLITEIYHEIIRKNVLESDNGTFSINVHH